MQYLQNIFNKKNIDRIRLIQFPFLYIVKKKKKISVSVNYNVTFQERGKHFLAFGPQHQTTN